MEWDMAVFIETVIIAAVVALGIMVGGAAIIRGTRSVASSVPPSGDAHGRFTSTGDSRYAAA
jgi:hypothetical protein